MAAAGITRRSVLNEIAEREASFAKNLAFFCESYDKCKNDTGIPIADLDLIYDYRHMQENLLASQRIAKEIASYADTEQIPYGQILRRNVDIRSFHVRPLLKEKMITKQLKLVKKLTRSSFAQDMFVNMQRREQLIRHLQETNAKFASFCASYAATHPQRLSFGCGAFLLHSHLMRHRLYLELLLKKMPSSHADYKDCATALAGLEVLHSIK